MRRISLFFAVLAIGWVASGCGDNLKGDKQDGGTLPCPSGCAAGQRCDNGFCLCDAISCGDGCCLNNDCVLPADQSANACGKGGIECPQCQGLTPTCNLTSLTCTDECGPGIGAC